MQIDNLKKITVASAREICALATAGGFELAAPEGASPAQYLNTLLGAKDLNPAVQFLAFALPPREAVWWACVCARDQLHDPVPQPLLAAVSAAEAWVRKPTDEHRRSAMSCAQATDLKTPAAWAAVAAFWSGGSLAPENLPGGRRSAAPPGQRRGERGHARGGAVPARNLPIESARATCTPRSTSRTAATAAPVRRRLEPQHVQLGQRLCDRRRVLRRLLSEPGRGAFGHRRDDRRHGVVRFSTMVSATANSAAAAAGPASCSRRPTPAPSFMRSTSIRRTSHTRAPRRSKPESTTSTSTNAVSTS